jgi:hypothetical protein
MSLLMKENYQNYNQLNNDQQGGFNVRSIEDSLKKYIEKHNLGIKLVVKDRNIFLEFPNGLKLKLKSSAKDDMIINLGNIEIDQEIVLEESLQLPEKENLEIYHTGLSEFIVRKIVNQSSSGPQLVGFVGRISYEGKNKKTQEQYNQKLKELINIINSLNVEDLKTRIAQKKADNAENQFPPLSGSTVNQSGSPTNVQISDVVPNVAPDLTPVPPTSLVTNQIDQTQAKTYSDVVKTETSQQPQQAPIQNPNSSQTKSSTTSEIKKYPENKKQYTENKLAELRRANPMDFIYNMEYIKEVLKEFIKSHYSNQIHISIVPGVKQGDRIIHEEHIRLTFHPVNSLNAPYEFHIYPPKARSTNFASVKIMPKKELKPVPPAPKYIEKNYREWILLDHRFELTDLIHIMMTGNPDGIVESKHDVVPNIATEQSSDQTLSNKIIDPNSFAAKARALKDGPNNLQSGPQIPCCYCVKLPKGDKMDYANFWCGHNDVIKSDGTNITNGCVVIGDGGFNMSSDKLADDIYKSNHPTISRVERPNDRYPTRNCLIYRNIPEGVTFDGKKYGGKELMIRENYKKDLWDTITQIEPDQLLDIIKASPNKLKSFTDFTYLVEKKSAEEKLSAIKGKKEFLVKKQFLKKMKQEKVINDVFAINEREQELLNGVNSLTYFANQISANLKIQIRLNINNMIREKLNKSKYGNVKKLERFSQEVYGIINSRPNLKNKVVMLEKSVICRFLIEKKFLDPNTIIDKTNVSNVMSDTISDSSLSPQNMGMQLLAPSVRSNSDDYNKLLKFVENKIITERELEIVQQNIDKYIDAGFAKLNEQSELIIIDEINKFLNPSKSDINEKKAFDVNTFIYDSIKEDVKIFCSNYSGDASLQKYEALAKLFAEQEIKIAENAQRFDDLKKRDPTNIYDENDKEDLLERTTYLSREYKKILDNKYSIGYVLSYNDTKTIRTLKQHLVINPHIIKADYSKRDATGFNKGEGKGYEAIFNVIPCIKFWFDVYIEGYFYHNIILDYANNNDLSALKQIKHELLKQIEKHSGDLVSKPNLLNKIYNTEREIRERSKNLKQKKEEYSDEALLSEEIEKNGRELSGEPSETKTDFETLKGDKQLEPLSRFKLSNNELIIDKIGKKNDIGSAIDVYNEDELFKKYLRGEELSGMEPTKIRTILNGFGDQKISNFCQRIRKTNKLTNENHKKVVGLIELKNNIKKLIIAILGSASESQLTSYSKDHIALMRFLTILKVAVIPNPNMEKLDKRINQYKADLTEEDKSKIATYFKSSDKISKLNNFSVIFDIFEAPKSDTNNKINKLCKYLKAIVKFAPIENEINNYLNTENKHEIHDIDTYIMENLRNQEFVNTTSIETSGKQLVTKNILDDLDKYNTPEIKYEIRQKLWNKGGFALDEWQINLIGLISNNESCLLTTPTGVGKTYTMMECISLIIDSINKEKKNKIKTMVYVSPSVQLALQNYANIMKTFTSIKVSLITESFIYEPQLSRNEKINIYVGTPIALSNYFSAKNFTFNIGLFDEIHLILPTYARNDYEKLRIKETIKLLGLCTSQFIGASATIPSVKILSRYIQSKCSQIPNLKLNVIDFFAQKHIPELPKLIEHVFDGNTFVNFKRNQDSGDIQKYVTKTGETERINLGSHVVSTQYLYELIMNGQFKDVLPALVFEKSEVHAFATFQELVERLKSENEKKYKNKIILALQLRSIIVESNLERANAPSSSPQSYKNQNKKIDEIFDTIRKCILTIGNESIPQEQHFYTQPSDLKKYRDAIYELLLRNVIVEKTKKDVEKAFKADKENIDKITIEMQAKIDEELNFESIVRTYAKMTLTQITHELKEIIDAYILYKGDYESNIYEDRQSLRSRHQANTDRLNYYLTCAGNEFKQLKESQIKRKFTIKTSSGYEPKILLVTHYDNTLQTNLINNLYLIEEFGKKTIENEFSKIGSGENDVIGINSDRPSEQVVKNDTLIKLANLYIDAAEFGITCIIPNLPWFIQFDVINAIKESNNDKTIQVAYVFTSKDMAIGIDYPLNSVIIKAPNGTNIQTENLEESKDFESILLVQMSGRCGRRKTQQEARDGNIYYYGISNYAEANTKKLIVKDNTDEKVAEGFTNLTREINKLQLSSLIILSPIQSNMAENKASIPSLSLITTPPMLSPITTQSIASTQSILPIPPIEITDRQIQQHIENEIIESKKIIVQLYKATLLQTNDIYKIELRDLPTVNLISLINDKFSAFNQPTFNLLKRLDPSNAKIKYGLKLLLDIMKKYDSSIITNNIIELIYAFDNQEENNQIKIETAIIKYVGFESNTIARLEKLNKLNQLVSKLIFLIFEIYNKNRDIVLLKHGKDDRDAIITQIKSLIRILHVAETGLLQYLNTRTLEKLFSEENSQKETISPTSSVVSSSTSSVVSASTSSVINTPLHSQTNYSMSNLTKTVSDKFVGSNWVQNYMGEPNYKIVETSSNGDCFFDTLRMGLLERGENYENSNIRTIVAESMTQADLENYKDFSKSDTDYKFIINEQIETLEQLKTHIKKHEYWADPKSIAKLEKHFNIKMIVLSEIEYRNNNYNSVLQCGQFITFNPNPDYIITTYSGNHYRLVTYDNKSIFTFAELPMRIKEMIVRTCMKSTERAGSFFTIREFDDFKRQLETQSPAQSAQKPNAIEQGVSILSLLM